MVKSKFYNLDTDETLSSNSDYYVPSEKAIKTYVDTNIPTVGNGTITLTQGEETKGTFTTNQSGDTTINLDVGGIWGNIIGDISDQEDLQELLDTKQDLLTSENAGNQIEIVEGGSGEDVTVSGNGSVFLEKAQADSLNSVTVSGGLKRSLLPDGYTQYDYISVNGDCYFITDYYPSNITEVKTKTFVHKQPTSPLVCRWTASPTNDTFGFYMGNVSGRLTVFYGRYSDTKYLNIENVKLNIEHDIYIGVKSITFDGTSYSITRDIFTSTQPIYIGAFNQTGSSLAGMMYGRIYPVEFIENGRTVKHYIPCKNNNGVIGLYEAITGTFINPTGSGTAKKGRPYINVDTIPSDYTRIEFVQSTGTQYIDSGVIANFANNKIEQTATVQYTTSNSNRELMGTNGYGFWGKNASDKIEAALGQTTVNDNALVKNVISWTTNPDGNALILNVNSNQYTSTASSLVDADYAYYVFALGIRIGSGASASFLCHAKMYDYTFAVDDEVVCYLIPARRNSDNVLGMYDIVTGTFKTNAGTGTFTAGSNAALPSPSNPLPIVSNNGELKLGSHGKNLFNKDSSPYLAGAYISSATVSQSTFYTTTNANYNVYRIEIKPNTTYTFGLIKANDPRWVVTDGNVILDTGSNGGGNAGTYKTITTGATAKYLYLSVAISGSYKCNDILQLEEGAEHTEYEAFHYVLVADGITETITDSANNSATAEMLLAIGDYKDTQELLSGVVTRKVGVKVLDGTENWAKGTSFYADMPFNALQSAHSCICNYYVGKSTDAYTADSDTVQVGYYVGGVKIWNRIYITANRTAYATANDFKTFLAQQYANGTPVIVVYPLATETTETVTEQTLTTVDGDNTLSIQASIENLPITANYTQKGGTVINWVGTNYYTKTETNTLLNAKQDTLISGTNIKTINNTSLLGSGNIDIQGGGSTYTAGDGIDITNDIISVDNTIALKSELPTVDQTFDGTSTNAQSGVAIAGELTSKQNTISDLSTIRSNATAGKSASDTIATYGNIVTHNINEFASAAQGALADTALQPNDNISELTNDAGYITSASLPVVNNATLTIQKNGTTVNTFTANASSNVTANITVPTTTNELTNNSDFQTGTQVATAIAVETGNRESADNNLQSQIDAIVSASDVFDIVGTYAELQAYDISTVPVNDIVKVLVDSSHSGAATYYRCIETSGTKSWSYIGSEGAYYTKAESDSNFVPQTRTVNSKALSSDITLTASDVGALPSSTVIPTVNDSTITIQKNGSAVDTFTLNQSSNKSIDITVPTATSDLTNDSGFITSADLPTNHVTTDSDQNITGTKTFVGTKKVAFKQSGNSDKLGFTLYAANNTEKGYLEFNPSNTIDGAPLMTLGNYATSATGLTQVGFRKYSSISGASGAYNLLMPMIADARTPFNLTTTYTNFYLPLGFTDGTTTIKTAKSGLVDISTLLPTVGNGTITINQGGTQKGTFTVNQSGNTTINLDSGGTVDQTYSSSSTNAQSGTAVAEAVSNCIQYAMVITDYTAS